MVDGAPGGGDAAGGRAASSDWSPRLRGAGAGGAGAGDGASAGEGAVAIVLKPGQQKVDADEFKKWVGSKLAKFKVPKKIYFTDVMPKTATGKIQRRIVAEEMLKKESRTSKL